MPFYELRTKTNARNLLIFIHGFGGSVTTTWQPLADALDKSSLVDWDFYGFEYNSTSPLSKRPWAFLRFMDPSRGIWEAEPSITVVATQFKTELEQLASKCERIAIVAHSMGGLVAQRVVLDSMFVRTLLISLVCFGTPSKGLAKASLLKRLKKYQIEDMGETSSFITSLRARWVDEGFLESPPFQFQVVAGDEDDFVPASSSLSEFPQRFQKVIPGNHTTILNPSTLSLQIIRSSLIESSLIPNPVQTDVRKIILAVDREDPDAGVEKELQRREGSERRRPYLFFFPAIADDLPIAYVDRLSLYTLPRILSQRSSMVSVVPLRWPSPSSQSDVASWLASVLATALGITATTVKDTLRSYPKARIFYTDMPLARASKLSQSVLKQFADFWRLLPDLAAPLFIVVCIRTDEFDLDKPTIQIMGKAIRFDDNLWGSLLPELDKLPPTYFESFDKHPSFLRLLAGRENTAAHFRTTFASLARLTASVRMRSLEESLETYQTL